MRQRTSTTIRAITAMGVCVGLLVCPSVTRADFQYTDFADTTGLSLVGSAATVGDVLRLTPAQTGQVGAAWFMTRQDVAAGFETEFRFRISELSEFVNGADGFVFVVQDTGTNAAGNGGSSLGYIPIPNSLGVEFDTFGLGVNDPPGDNHVSVQVQGPVGGSPQSLGDTGNTLATDLSDGAVHDVKIAYAPGSLDVFIDDFNTPVLSVAVDVEAVLGLSDGDAYVGFTASTGGGFENHDLHDWSFASVPEPSTLAMAAMAAVGAWFAVRRRRPA